MQIVITIDGDTNLNECAENLHYLLDEALEGDLLAHYTPAYSIEVGEMATEYDDCGCTVCSCDDDELTIDELRNEAKIRESYGI